MTNNPVILGYLGASQLVRIALLGLLFWALNRFLNRVLYALTKGF